MRDEGKGAQADPSNVTGNLKRTDKESLNRELFDDNRNLLTESHARQNQRMEERERDERVKLKRLKMKAQTQRSLQKQQQIHRQLRKREQKLAQNAADSHRMNMYYAEGKILEAVRQRLDRKEMQLKQKRKE